MRLAVAASGSSLALETAAQNARRSTRALGFSLTTVTNLRYPICKGSLTPRVRLCARTGTDASASNA